MSSEYSLNDEGRLARLRERIGTSTKAIRRQQMFDEHVRGSLGHPSDVDEFRRSFLDLTKELRIAGSFDPTGLTCPLSSVPHSTSSALIITTSVLATPMMSQA